jgi:hypothetical protein
LSRIYRLLDTVSRHRLIAVSATASVVLVASVSALTVLLSNGPSGPKSRYGNPALDAIVALPEQLYSPPSPLESSRDAAKRVEPLVTHDLFVAMSAPRERETDYRMAVVAQQRGKLTARAYIDDHAVRNGDDSPTSVSRTVIVVQKMSFPGGRAWEDRFGVIVDVTPVNGTWKAKSFAPAPLLDVMAKTPPPPPPSAPPAPPPSTPNPPPPPPPTVEFAPPPVTPSTAEIAPPPSRVRPTTPRTGPTATTSSGPSYKPKPVPKAPSGVG